MILSNFFATANVGLSDNTPLKVRIIPYQKYCGAVNMALDRYFSNLCHNDSDLVLRFYGWEPFCVSFGYHQKADTLLGEKISARGFDIVRRPTGGRAILHAEELTYSIVVPKQIFHHHALYEFVHRLLYHSFRDLGIEVSMFQNQHPYPQLSQTADDFACFTRSAQSEIQYKGKKVVGSAQKIYRNSILQHGSILLGPAHLEIVDFIARSEKQSAALKQEFSQKTISIREITSQGITPEKITTTLLKQLELRQNIFLYSKNISDAELNCARENYEVGDRCDKK